MCSSDLLENFKRKKAVCGLDLSSGGDLTTLALEFPYEDEKTGDRKYYIYSHSFIPKRRMQEHMEKEDNAPYVIWEKDGLLTATIAAKGIKTDYKTILKHLNTLIDAYEIDLEAIAYDPHNASAFLLDLEDFGCDLVEIKQSARSLNDTTVDFQLEARECPSACDEREPSDSTPVVVVGKRHAGIAVDKLVDGDIGLMVGRLGAPFAVFGTAPGAGVYDGARIKIPAAEAVGDFGCGF